MLGDVVELRGLGEGPGQMTYPQHEHRRHRLSRRAWRSPDWHGCSYIRRRDGQLSSHHTRQHHERLSSRFERASRSIANCRTSKQAPHNSVLLERRRRLTARASCTSDSVLSFGLLAGTFERGLLAAGALGFSCADAGLRCAGAAAAGGWDSHNGLRRVDG